MKGMMGARLVSVDSIGGCLRAQSHEREAWKQMPMSTSTRTWDSQLTGVIGGYQCDNIAIFKCQYACDVMAVANTHAITGSCPSLHALTTS